MKYNICNSKNEFNNYYSPFGALLLKYYHPSCSWCDTDHVDIDWLYLEVNTTALSDTTPPQVTITSPVNGTIITSADPNITVRGYATDDVGIVNMSYTHWYEWGGMGGLKYINITTNATINWTVELGEGVNTMTWTAYDKANNSGNASVTVTYESEDEEEKFDFDTGASANPYPAISGTHSGTITPNQTVTVNTLYTYPCAGTGGHTEHVRIWNSTWEGAEANWGGYVGDWHNITFSDLFILASDKTYNYTIHTGSYPQIHHTDDLDVASGTGTITCDKFIDANGRVYYDWIPA